MYNNKKDVLPKTLTDYICFWGHTQKKTDTIDKSCFSQWFPSVFTENGKKFYNAEQYMMYYKAKTFLDNDIAELILMTYDPRHCKKLGRKVKNFNNEKWNNVKYGIVKQGNLHKFYQNSQLNDFLQSTSYKTLIEASPYDKIWGVGMKEDNNNISTPDKWQGENLLGFCLMDVRDELR